MPNYAPNPYYTQTAIGQSLQNLVGAYFQSKLMEGQRADKQAALALKQRQLDDVTLPMKQMQMDHYAAQSRHQDAAAGKLAEETARMQSIPGVMAQVFTGLNVPQINTLRQGQQTGSFGEAPTIPGLDQLAPGGNWMPTYADPQTMQKLADADFLSAAGANAEHMAKARGELNDQNFERDSVAGLFTPQQMTARVQANYKGAPYSAPNANGQVGNLVTGQANLDTPQARASIGKDNAYSAHQYAGARQADAAAGLNRANTAAVPQKLANETAKATAYSKSQDEYQKGRVKDQMASVVGLVDSFFGIAKDNTGAAKKGTPVNTGLYNAVMRDLEENQQGISAGTVQQSLQRIAQSNPTLVSVMPETGWTGMGDRTPQIRPQLRGGQKQPAQGAKPAGNVRRISNEADYNSLQPGEKYYDPKGVLRTKGGA